MKKKEDQPARQEIKTLIKLEQHGRLTYLSWEGENEGCFLLQIADENLIEAILGVLERERDKFAAKNNDHYVNAISEKMIEISLAAAEAERIEEMTTKEHLDDIRRK